MFLVLKRLHSLWHLILVLSSLCLIASISLLTLNLGHNIRATLIAPLIASIISIAIFAYGLWGKSNPYLLPTSSPRSNPCTRCVRYSGTAFLASLWFTSVSFFAVSTPVPAKALGGVALLIGILIIIESIGSSRLGREQRRILKEEARRLDMIRLTASGATLDEVQGKKSKKKRGKNASKDTGSSTLKDDNCNNNDRLDDDSSVTVEIVRPEAIDPATVIYNQQILYESLQRQHQQQYQQYIFQQQQSKDDSSSNNNIEYQEGKFDNILLESSFKLEIPINGPLPSSHSLQQGVLHPPSAPPLLSVHPYSTHFTKSSTVSETVQPSESSSSSAETITKTTQSLRTSLRKSDISPMGIQIMIETNPFLDQDYRIATELSASAPPYVHSTSPQQIISTSELSQTEGQTINDSSNPFSDDSTYSIDNSTSRTMIIEPAITIPVKDANAEAKTP